MKSRRPRDAGSHRKPRPKFEHGSRTPQAARPPAKAAQPPLKAGPVFRRSSSDLVLIYGFHAVSEALRAKRRELLDLFATPAAAARLDACAAAAGVRVHVAAAEDLSRRLGAEAVHQGVLLEARPLPARGLDDIVSNSGIVLALDQITDPHNVGAILRSAAAFAVDAVVTTERHAPQPGGVLAKAASGGLEHVPLIEVVNLARALGELKDLGYLRIGLDSEGPLSLSDAPLTRPLVLVLGGEGKGLRRLTRENCDFLARLDMKGAIKSLNVSNACAVALSIASEKLDRP